VKEVYKIVLRLLKHEASELFKFHGMDIYNEHNDAVIGFNRDGLLSEMFKDL
jgi:hypothetical protein